MKLCKNVTILMAAYNAGSFINDSINSLLNQTYQDYDLLIINDGSTDDTEDKILAFNDEKIKYIKNAENLGVGNSIFNGMKYIDSKYVVRFDADDIAFPNWVESLVSFMDCNPSINLASCLYDVIDLRESGDKRIESPLQIRTRALFHCPIAQYIIIDNEFIKKKKISYDPKLRVAIDYDLYLKVLRVGEIAKIPQVLVKYRKHSLSLTSQNYSMQDRISTDLKFKLLEELSEMTFSQLEKEVFMDFTFHRNVNDGIKIDLLKNVLKKIRYCYFNQNKYLLDKKYYIGIENELLRIFFIQNKKMGYSILTSYLKNYIFKYNVWFFFPLLIRVFHYQLFKGEK